MRWRWKAWTVYSARSLQDFRPCYSEHLPVIWGGELPNENAFPSVEAANPMLSLIVRHWNSIISELETDGVHVPSFLRSKRERCRGVGIAREPCNGV
jgi:hypothetical protein